MRYATTWAIAILFSAVLALAQPEAEPDTTQPATTRPAASQPTTHPASQPATSPTSAPANSGVDLSSPQATMFTFLKAMGDTNRGSPTKVAAAWARALATLDTSAMKDSSQAHHAAEQLMGVLDRLGEVTQDELPDKASAEQTHITRFRYFPRQPEHAWVWKELKAFQKAPDGFISLDRDYDGNWHFTARTVAGIDELLYTMQDLPERYSPTSGWLANLIGPTLSKTRALGWLALLGALFLGLLFGKLAQAALRNIAGRLEGRSWRARGVLFSSSANPVSLALLTLGLAVGLRFIHMEDRLFDFSEQIIRFLYILSLAWLLFNLIEIIDIALHNFARRTTNHLDDVVVPLIRKALRLFLVVVFSLVIAQTVLGVDITGWLAGLGLVGLAVSLAAQDSIKNVFGSITIFFDHSFSVGDRVRYMNLEGDVQSIGFRSTKLRTLDGHLYTIPNMRFIDTGVENIARRPYIPRTFNILLAYNTPPEKIEEAVKITRDILAEPEIAAGVGHEATPPRVAFDEFNPDSFNIVVSYWYTLSDGRDRWTYLDHAQALNLKLLRAFKAAGLEFRSQRGRPATPP